MKNFRIDVVDEISPREFKQQYLATESPLLIKGGCQDWEATRKWNLDYFKSQCGETEIAVKRFKGDQILVDQLTLREYCEQLQLYEEDKNREPPPYCHDIPIFYLAYELTNDVTGFPTDFVPSVYRNWWNYCQFFLGPSGSVTPLHFDCLLTNNLFFQISGTKRFTLIPASEAEKCGRFDWRWFELDPENPDLERFAEYESEMAQVIDVEEGDILFIPSGTLHHVRSLDMAISFNIDFHNFGSVFKGVLAANRDIPAVNLFYNRLLLLRLLTRFPEPLLLKHYSSYMNYVS